MTSTTRSEKTAVARRTWFDEVPTTSWTIVMTCGVVSIDLSIDHQPVLSAILLWFAAAVWVLLTLVLGLPLVFQTGRLRRETASPAVLTIVAATAVLGSRLVVDGYRAVAAVLLVLAAIEWLALSGPVLRRWVTPTVGVSFLIAVAADAVALLSATLAVSYQSRLLYWIACLLVVVGLCFYGFAAARFDLGQLLSGRGDHWIVGGALAISALAAAKATAAASAVGLSSPDHQVLTVGTVVLWSAAMAWLPLLLVGEFVRPRFSDDLRRWATAFPMGMYAACSFAVGDVTGAAVIVEFAQVWTWVAFAATVVLLAGLSRRLVRAYRG